MAVHLTNAQAQTIMSKTVGACTPVEIYAMLDLMGRTRFNVSDEDFPSNLANETTLATLFPAGSTQW